MQGLMERNVLNKRVSNMILWVIGPANDGPAKPRGGDCELLCFQINHLPDTSQPMAIQLKQ